MNGSAKLPPPASVGITDSRTTSLRSRSGCTTRRCPAPCSSRVGHTSPSFPWTRDTGQWGTTPATSTRGCCAACSRSAGTPTTTGSRSCSAGATRLRRHAPLDPPIPRTEHAVKPEGKDRLMLPTIIIGAFVLAILWPFIRLGYELIKLAGRSPCSSPHARSGRSPLSDAGPGLISACRRHAGTKKDDTVPPTAANSDRAPMLPEYSSVR